MSRLRVLVAGSGAQVQGSEAGHLHTQSGVAAEVTVPTPRAAHVRPRVAASRPCRGEASAVGAGQPLSEITVKRQTPTVFRAIVQVACHGPGGAPSLTNSDMLICDG